MFVVCIYNAHTISRVQEDIQGLERILHHLARHDGSRYVEWAVMSSCHGTGTTKPMHKR
jgi:hypothetical protein